MSFELVADATGTAHNSAAAQVAHTGRSRLIDRAMCILTNDIRRTRPTPYRPVNFGARFSINAAMPSALSSKAKSEWNRRRSSFTPCDSGVS